MVLIAMPSLSQAQRWQRRAEARPQKLREAVISVFVERGYREPRLDQVARLWDADVWRIIDVPLLSSIIRRGCFQPASRSGSISAAISMRS